VFDASAPYVLTKLAYVACPGLDFGFPGGADHLAVGGQ